MIRNSEERRNDLLPEIFATSNKNSRKNVLKVNSKNFPQLNKFAKKVYRTFKIAKLNCAKIFCNSITSNLGHLEFFLACLKNYFIITAKPVIAAHSLGVAVIVNMSLRFFMDFV